MWKKFNNNRASRSPVIGDPVQTRPAHDGNAYRGGPVMDINSVQSPPDRGQPPPKPPRDSLKGLPRLPFEPASPPPLEHDDYDFRPISSIYSQSSPNPATYQCPSNSHGNTAHYVEDVSPPSSPDSAIYKMSIREQTNERDVSPIDEIPDISRIELGGSPGSRPGSRPPISNIPVLRREKRRNQVAATVESLAPRKDVGHRNERRTTDPRWDPYSGEQTSSEKGKPQSVRAGQFTPPGLPKVRGPATGIKLGSDSRVTAEQKPQKSFGDRVRNMRINAPAERPDWKGTSGRATMVSPVEDQLHIAPLNIRRRSSKRIASPDSGRSPVSVIQVGGDETRPVSPSPKYPDHTIRTGFSSRDNPEVPYTDPESELRTASSRNAQPQGHQRNISSGSIERNFREAFKGVAFTDYSTEPYIQPPSRFSVTTYAPSEAHSTPRPSTDTWERPPLPTPPQTYTEQQPSPILNRKRPKVIESPKNIISRKAVPSSPVFINMSSTSAVTRPSSTQNQPKPLPQSPAEAQSSDLVSSLQAQLDDLAHRKQNIMRSIRQMTEVMPMDGLVVTSEVARKREGEKRKVEGLREEEADVRRREHEVGLRLHRAWKRRDEKAVFEPTGLWVRRVTG